MKKMFISLLTTATVFSSMSTIGLAEEKSPNESPLSASTEREHPFVLGSQNVLSTPTIQNPLEEWLNQKATLYTRLQSTEFFTLPLLEQFSLIKEFFALQTKIHQEYQITVSNRTADLESVKQNIQTEYRESQIVQSLLEDSIQLSKQQDREVILNSKNALTETLSSIQEGRKAGRNVRESLSTQQQFLQASLIRMWEKVALTDIEKGNQEGAIQSLSELVELSGGSQDYIHFISELSEKEISYVLWRNELVGLKQPFIHSDNRLYISLDDLNAFIHTEVIKGEESETNKVIFSHNEHQLVYEGEKMTFDGQLIGNPSVWKSDEKTGLWVDAEVIFELFGYNVNISAENQVITVQENVYPMEEIDSLSVESLTESIIE